MLTGVLMIDMRKKVNLLGVALITVLVIILQVACSGVCDASQIKDISGSDHVLVLLSNGTVWAWGSNGCGQCGQEINPATGDNIITSPQMIEGISNVTAVVSATSFSLALRDDGTVWSWGSNIRGQLGRGTSSTGSIYQPARVPDLSNIVAIAASDQMYAMALRDDGTVWAWGDNFFGQMGDGIKYNPNSPSYVTTPVMIEGLNNVKVIAAGPKNVFVIKTDGTVWAWGDNGTLMGFDGTHAIPTISTTPCMVPGLIQAHSLAVGASHALVLKDDGTVWAWGDDSRGKLGIGSPYYDTPDYLITYVPVQVRGLNDITAIHVGTDFSIALGSDGSVWAWGANYDGRLGDGTKANKNAPVCIHTNNATLITGDFNVFVVDNGGTIYGSGDNGAGQLCYKPAGNSDHKAFPVKINFNPGDSKPETAAHGFDIIPEVTGLAQSSPSDQAINASANSLIIPRGNTILVIGVILFTVIMLGFLTYLVVRK